MERQERRKERQVSGDKKMQTRSDGIKIKTLQRKKEDEENRKEELKR